MGVVTDRRRLLPRGSREAQSHALVLQAIAAAEAGADFLQVREKDLDAGELLALVSNIVHQVTGSSLAVLVNDRLDVALAAGAHGVHLPEAGMPPREIRALVAAAFLVGQSVHGGRAVEDGADFGLFGTVFPSASKRPGHETAGVNALAAAARRAAVPLLAIGGVDETTVHLLAHACSGVAAIGWFATSDAQRLSDSVRLARRAFDTITPVI